MAKTISENQLVIPALAVLSQQKDVITTKTLREGILSMIKAKKSDLSQLTDRNQTVISSRIDNLISHRTLEGLADYSKIGGKVYIRITPKGRTLLSQKLLELV